jgi:hypothetical protein
MNASPSLAREPDGPKNSVLKIFGAEIPLPPWAVSIVAVVAIVFVPVFLVVSVKHMGEDDKVTKELNQKNDNLNKVKAELAKSKDDLVKMNDRYGEISKHSKENAEEFHRDPKLVVLHYPSDGCISVRYAGTETQWIKPPSGSSPQSPAPGAIDGGVSSELRAPGDRVPYGGKANVNSSHRLTQPGLAAISLSYPIDGELGFRPVQATRGRCQNPHPGQFSSWNGTKQGCWLQVWRRWSDGCTHYQWFNSCSSSWDSDQSGRPRVYWTRCTH